MEPKKRVLFVDDSAARYCSVRDHAFSSFDIKWALTTSEAIQQLSAEHFDIICLDHDLGNPNRTGMDVVDCLCKYGHPSLELVVVHTHNVVARVEMAKRLSDAGIPHVVCPFREDMLSG